MTNNNEVNAAAGDLERDAERMDPVSLLFKNRIVMVTGQVSEQMSRSIIAQLRQLSALKPDETIEMIIDSPGGSVLAGLAIYDTMRTISAPIRTVGIGMQMSMGSILLAAGDTRMMTENSKLMIHQISGGTEGKASAQEIGMAFSEQLHEDLKNIYVRHIGLTHEYWDLSLEHDSFLTAKQALEMGFIQEIVPVNQAKKTAYEGEVTRSVERKSLTAELNKAATKYIENMSAADIVKTLNSISADGGTVAAYRGVLLEKLAKCPEFWTETKKAEMAAKAAAASAANQNDEPAFRKTAPKHG